MAMKMDGYAEGHAKQDEVLAHSGQTLVWWMWRRTATLRVVLGKTKS